jgi:hypothetical protein
VAVEAADYLHELDHGEPHMNLTSALRRSARKDLSAADTLERTSRHE